MSIDLGVGGWGWVRVDEGARLWGGGGCRFMSIDLGVGGWGWVRVDEGARLCP